MVSRENPSGVPLKTAAKPQLRGHSFQAVREALEEESALAGLVVEARTRAQLTREQLAERMGLPLAAIIALESGKGAPGLSTLRRIARATGTRLEISFAPRRTVQQTKTRPTKTRAA